MLGYDPKVIYTLRVGEKLTPNMIIEISPNITLDIMMIIDYILGQHKKLDRKVYIYL